MSELVFRYLFLWSLQLHVYVIQKNSRNLQFVLCVCLQVGFIAQGANSTTQFEVDLAEKVSLQHSLICINCLKKHKIFHLIILKVFKMG